jgi:PhnB protein
MMQLNPYLSFNGQCKEAFDFYAGVLGGQVEFMMTWGEMPEANQFPAETHNLIMHATVRIGDSTLMGADSPPGRYEEPKGISISLHFNDKAEGGRVFKALSEGGSVTMPFEQTFWSPGFGMCIDRYGIPWMVNTDQQP